MQRWLICSTAFILHVSEKMKPKVPRPKAEDRDGKVSFPLCLSKRLSHKASASRIDAHLTRRGSESFRASVLQTTFPRVAPIPTFNSREIFFRVFHVASRHPRSMKMRSRLAYDSLACAGRRPILLGA